MRTVSMDDYIAEHTKGLEGVAYDEAAEKAEDELLYADYNELESALGQISSKLKQFGLEILMYEENSDRYVFDVVKRNA